MPFGIGTLEIVLILVAALVIFGPKRLPELGRSMGRGIREFKNSVTSDKDDDDDVRELERSGAAASEHPLEGEVVHDRRS
ncbi:MAG TPA: twin-arginine translocase TatA/TatE family subunit [Solirubrobacterales bacterium]|nr:twin-arginine translocase TatA/TatE family subunit [Solirubrobacterales bacterium]